MGNAAPFVDKTVPCPHCKEPQRLRYPSPAFYQAVEREADHYVAVYRWNRPGCDHIRPEHHAVWQCPSCLFADFIQLVERPDKSFKDLFAHKALDALEPEQRALLAWLRTWVSDSEDPDASSAAARHLGALFVGSRPDEAMRDHRKLGRLALRTAWLFREEGGLEPAGGLLGELAGGLEGREGPWQVWPEMPRSEGAAMTLAVEAFEHSYANEPVYDKVEDVMTVLGLICHLLRRLELHDRAVRAATEMHRAAMDAKRELIKTREAARRGGTLNAHDERAYNLKLASIGPALEAASDLRREVLAIMVEEHRPTFERVLGDTLRQPTASRERALKRAGVPPEVVVQLKRRGILK